MTSCRIQEITVADESRSRAPTIGDCTFAGQRVDKPHAVRRVHERTLEVCDRVVEETQIAGRMPAYERDRPIEWMQLAGCARRWVNFNRGWSKRWTGVGIRIVRHISRERESRIARRIDPEIECTELERLIGIHPALPLSPVVPNDAGAATEIDAERYSFTTCR